MDAELGKPNAEPHGRDVEPLTKSLLEMLLQSRESGLNLLNVRSADNQSKLVSANPPGSIGWTLYLGQYLAEKFDDGVTCQMAISIIDRF
jgi:hypothetical protein